MCFKPNGGAWAEAAWCSFVAESVKFEKNSCGSVITEG